MLELANLVHEFRRLRVLLVGDLILDRYVYGDAERISPEAPVPVLRVVERRETVGGCGNVAACLRALGAGVQCCGVLGDDPDGIHLKRLLDGMGVDTSGIVALTDRPTTAKTRLIGLAQHRHRQQLIRVDEENASPLLATDAEQLLRLAREGVAGADIVCIEDYDKGVASRQLVEEVIAEARTHGKLVLVDPARLSGYERYHGADVLTPNRQELAIAVGRELPDLDAVYMAADELLDRINGRAMIATLDRDGAAVIVRDVRPEHLPTTPRAVYDNTGAGDAVLAMLAAALGAGASFVNAAKLANIAGGLEVERFGCVPISADEVLAELRLVDRLENGKLRSLDELVAELAIRRDRGETVVFTNGCFDVLHAGHVDFLKRAHKHGSVLVVGLNSDASVRLLGKGEDRPINTFADRAAMLGAMQCVDYVVGFDEPEPGELICKVRPDVLVKGEDWAGRGVVGAAFVESNGGKVVLLPLTEGLSTTALIERIRGGAANVN